MSEHVLIDRNFVSSPLFFSQKLALYTCQRAIRNMQMAKSWPWMQIWMMIKPNLK